MQDIPAETIDMILCDLPYGITKNKWDLMIDPTKLWQQYERIIKPNGAILLFGQDKFTAKMMLSNEKLHRYNIIWDKVLKTGFLNAKRMPLREHEQIAVFYKNLPTYNTGVEPAVLKKAKKKRYNENWGEFYKTEPILKAKGKYPTSILKFARPSKQRFHPTQKPDELLEFLIKTYTNEGDVVLDNCMGSGSTGVACLNTNRSFIGIEINEDYFKIAEERLKISKNKQK